MIKHALIVSSWVVFLLLSGCNSPVVASTDPTSMPEFVTATGEAETVLPDVTPSGTPALKVTHLSIPPLAATGTASPMPENDEPPCDRVAPGSLLDVTIPDDTLLRPGEAFSKTWRLVNKGRCPWDHTYALVWFSGDTFGAPLQQYLVERIEPGQQIDLTVEMVAPDRPGPYSGYWMLRNNQGELFGLGPGGDSPFWVRVQVAEASTATPVPTALPTPTSVVLIASTLTVRLNQPADLDTGTIGVEGEDDLVISMDEEKLFQVLEANGARLVVYGEAEPGERACRQASFNEEPILFSMLPPSVRLCYRTSQSLPGTLFIREYDAGTGLITLEFTTWAVP